MKTISCRNRPRVRALSGRRRTCTASPIDGEHVWFAAGDKLNALDPASGKTRALDRRRRACRHGLRRPAPVPARREPHPEDRSEDRAGARHHPRARRRRRLGAGVGRRARSGSGSIATARSIRSIPRPARSCARSSPIASSPASPGSTASSGTAPGKATRANCGASIRRTGEVLEQLEMPAGVGVSGPRVRRRRSVLLRRRQERQGARRAPAEAEGAAKTPRII